MIQNLYIKNFILIDTLSLDFNRGFSAFTGETGAGKSIIMDAISLLCGERANASMIRTGCDQTIIEGTFTVNPSMEQTLCDAGFDSDEIVIVTREFDRNGKSTCRINHRTVTLSFLKELLENQIDIHSQHDHQYLLNPKYHLSLLDSYCNEPQLLQSLQQKYHQYDELRKEYNKAEQTSFSEAQEDLLRYQIQEIVQANIEIGEDEQLEEKIKIASNFEKIFSKIQTAISLLEHEHGINTQLYEAIHQLKQVHESEEVAQVQEELSSCYYTLNDLQDRLQTYLDQMNVDEYQLNQWNERLYLLNKLKRKYGPKLEDVLQRLQVMQEELNQIAHREEILATIQKQRDTAYEQYEALANQMHDIRVQKSELLQQQIQKQLQDLQLPHARLAVEITPCTANKKGMDDICFLISMNPGEPLRPLHKVASGGELSRLMLGLKTIFTHLQGVELVIFDEI
ncbi:MAG: DNA repair protein RecN, partial [Erysipelotrichaceae bacterium]|nr:DNA repair protein RecN [Erysipelotrichaceae bacterium]